MLIPICKGDQWGYCDINGNVAVPPIYDYADWFCERLARVEISDRCGYLNEDTSVAIDFKFADAGQFSSGTAACQATDDDSGKWGYIDNFGRWVIVPTYREAFEFSNGGARVSVTPDSWGIINKYGEWIIDPKYAYLGDVCDGLILAATNLEDRRGFLKLQGDWQILPEFPFAYSFSNGLACVSKGNGYGYISADGTVEISFDYSRGQPFSKVSAPVEQDNLWHLVDRRGAKISDRFAVMGSFSSGLAPFRKAQSSKIGFINEYGEIVIKPKYNDVGMFVDEFCHVYFDRGVGVIDKNGNEVFTP